jgi:ClpP class serine protease
MGAKIKDSDRKKYAIYLRAESKQVVDRLQHDNRSVSSVLAQLVSQYRSVKEHYPGAIEQARIYIERKGLDFASDQFVDKVQTYLSPDEGACLEEYARKWTDENDSVAMNRIICEIIAIATICPSVLAKVREIGNKKKVKE